MEFWFLKKNVFLESCILFCIKFSSRALLGIFLRELGLERGLLSLVTGETE
jgi:hypothetical protein